MTYVIAGGGTGGHVFPAIAVADAIKHIDENAEVLFIGTERGLEYSLVPKAGYRLETIVISGIKGRALTDKLRALFQLPIAVFESMKVLRRVKAKAVLGVGGYASGPAIIAAVLLRIPVGLCEPNSVPGLTNRALGRFAKKVFTAFKCTTAYFSPSKVQLVGNAVRKKLAFVEKKQKAEGEAARILVLGGSQGARALNQKLPAAFRALKDRAVAFELWHQSGVADAEETSQRYKELGLDAKVTAFIDDMSAAYQWADLVICRSGATTCSEVLVAGRVAIFVPLPTAIYDHQMLNARELVDEGASIVISQAEITASGLAEVVAKLLTNQPRIESMITSARSLAKPNASDDIARSFMNRFMAGMIVICGTHFFTGA